MKSTLIVLSLACLVGTLSAIPLDFELPEFTEVELPQHFDYVEPQELDEVKPQIYPEIEENQHLEEEHQQPNGPSRPMPQFHNNALRSQGPFSGKLANVVLNRQGVQKTVQKNSIDFNLRFAQALKQLLQEEELEQNEE